MSRFTKLPFPPSPPPSPSTHPNHSPREPTGRRNMSVSEKRATRQRGSVLLPRRTVVCSVLEARATITPVFRRYCRGRTLTIQVLCACVCVFVVKKINEQQRRRRRSAQKSALNGKVCRKETYSSHGYNTGPLTVLFRCTNTGDGRTGEMLVTRRDKWTKKGKIEIDIVRDGPSLEWFVSERRRCLLVGCWTANERLKLKLEGRFSRTR